VSRSRNRTAERKAGSGHHDGLTLLDAVRLWPTPTAADGDRTSTGYPRGNPTLAGAVRWPTPKGSAAHQGRPRPQDRGDLQAAVLWPTPTAGEGTGYQSGTRSDTWRPTLAATAKMAKAGIPPDQWPTPTAANRNDREDLASWQARQARERAKGRNGNGMGTPLAVAVRLWPTPKASDGDGSGGSTRGRGNRSNLSDRVAQAQGNATLLNPAWVEALMGLPPGWTQPPAGWKAPRRSRAGRRRQATPNTTGSRPAPSQAASPTAPAGSPRSATPSSPTSPRSPAAGH